MEDDWIIRKAYGENWILITNDKDFGEIVYWERRPHRGIVLLRLDDECTGSKIDAIGRLLTDYADRIPDSFAVVTDTGIRFARG